MNPEQTLVNRLSQAIHALLESSKIIAPNSAKLATDEINKIIEQLKKDEKTE